MPLASIRSGQAKVIRSHCFGRVYPIGKTTPVCSPYPRPCSKTTPSAYLFRDGDRRRLEYPCLDCGDLTPFLWEQVVGRERGETPEITCLSCGVPHGEDARRKMLSEGRMGSPTRRPDG